MTDQRRAPRSVADPDREAYDRSVRENARLQAQRQQREAARAASLDQAAENGGNVMTTIDGAAGSAKKYVSNPRIQAKLAGTGRLAGGVGTALSAYDAWRQYEKDVAGGMPGDEAFVRAAGGFAGGEVGGKLGMAGGAITGGAVGGRIYPHPIPIGTGAVIGGVWGGLEGQERGKNLGKRLVEPYRGAKEWAKGVTRPLYDPIYLYDSMTRGR